MLTHATRHIKEGFGYISDCLNKSLICNASKISDKGKLSTRNKYGFLRQYGGRLDAFLGKRANDD